MNKIILILPQQNRVYFTQLPYEKKWEEKTWLVPFHKDPDGICHELLCHFQDIMWKGRT